MNDFQLEIDTNCAAAYVNKQRCVRACACVRSDCAAKKNLRYDSENVSSTKRRKIDDLPVLLVKRMAGCG